MTCCHTYSSLCTVHKSLTTITPGTVVFSLIKSSCEQSQPNTSKEQFSKHANHNYQKATTGLLNGRETKIKINYQDMNQTIYS